MKMLDHARGAARTFGAQRARALLTLSGIVIGTGSIVMLAGLLRGAEEALMKLNQGVNDSDSIRIRRDEPPQDQLGKPTRELSRSDGQALEGAPGLEGVGVVAEASREARAEWRGRQKRVRLVGASASAREMYRLELVKGRFLDDEDQTEGRRVAIIGWEVWKELLEEHPDPLGLQLPIDGETWTIAGVLAHKPVMGHGDGTWMWDRRVLVPRMTFDAVFDPTHRVTSIWMRAPSSGAKGGRTKAGEISARVAAMGRVAEKVLLRRHLGVKNFELDDRQGAKQEQLIIDIIQILLLGTGLMSLFVGGINIMNIMLVTVTERTREIGIRRAIGASPGDILTQFLVEAASISLAGGVVGVTGGLGATWLLSRALDSAFGGFPFHPEPWAIGLGLALALLTGITFGLFPAWRAGRLNPVDALRYE